MSNKGQSLQGPVPETRYTITSVSIYLVNGIKLQGQVESFDHVCPAAEEHRHPNGLQACDLDRSRPRRQHSARRRRHLSNCGRGMRRSPEPAMFERHAGNDRAVLVQLHSARHLSPTTWKNCNRWPPLPRGHRSGVIGRRQPDVACLPVAAG